MARYNAIRLAVADTEPATQIVNCSQRKIMTKDEAIEMLKTAPRDDKPSKLNPSLTRRQAAEIVEKGIKAYKKETLDPLFEKRVYQVCHNQ